MGDELNSSSEELLVLMDEDSAASSSATSTPVKKSSSAEIATSSASSSSSSTRPSPFVVAGGGVRGNALYARLTELMHSAVSVGDAVKEMNEMSKQIAARKPTPQSALWDTGEEVADAGSGVRMPLKRTGPPAAVIAAPSRGLSQSAGKKLIGPPASRLGGATATNDKSSSSGSDESNDAPPAPIDKPMSRSIIPATSGSSQVCIQCFEPASSSPSNPLLVCGTCGQPMHAKCTRPNVEEKDFASARFVFTCADCPQRPRSQSPKPRIQMVAAPAMPDKRRKKEESLLPVKGCSGDERKKKEGGKKDVILGKRKAESL